MKLGTQTKRYAVYFAPSESSALHSHGSAWLGRDARTNELSVPSPPPSISLESWRTCTEAPRRYGFHATLKPPFELAEGTTRAQLTGALRHLAARQRCFHLPPLSLGVLGRFLALVLSGPSADLHQLAADCVRDLDELRAPPESEDLARRMNSSLNAAERHNLTHWGYPYVLDTWRFHMTLTSSLAPEDLTVFRNHLAERFDAVCREPLVLDSVCLFEEPAPRAPLILINRFLFSK